MCTRTHTHSLSLSLSLTFSLPHPLSDIFLIWNGKGDNFKRQNQILASTHSAHVIQIWEQVPHAASVSPYICKSVNNLCIVRKKTSLRLWALQPTQYYTPEWAHILRTSQADKFLMFRKCIMKVIAAIILHSPYTRPGKWYRPIIHSGDFFPSWTENWCSSCMQSLCILCVLTAFDTETGGLTTHRQRCTSPRQLYAKLFMLWGGEGTDINLNYHRQNMLKRNYSYIRLKSYEVCFDVCKSLRRLITVTYRFADRFLVSLRE